MMKNLSIPIVLSLIGFGIAVLAVFVPESQQGRFLSIAGNAIAGAAGLAQCNVDNCK